MRGSRRKARLRLRRKPSPQPSPASGRGGVTARTAADRGRPGSPARPKSGLRHDVRVAPARYDGRNDQQSRSPALDPISAEGLGDREIAQVVPAWIRGGRERLAGSVVGDDGFDTSRGARRRLPIGVDENLDETEGEARSRVDCGKAGRIPALAEQAGTLAGPDGMGAGDDAPKPSQRYLKFQDGGASRCVGYPRMVETRRVWRSE